MPRLGLPTSRRRRLGLCSEHTPDYAGSRKLIMSPIYKGLRYAVGAFPFSEEWHWFVVGIDSLQQQQQ